MSKPKLSRRSFLLGAGAAGAAGVAAIATKVAQPVAPGTTVKEETARKGYQLTEHVRNYYRTTQV
jgi:hypothetical protein